MIELRKHLPPEPPHLDHATLCNVKARRYLGGRLVKTEPVVVDLATFRELTVVTGQCGRCLVKLYAREGIRVARR